MSRTRLSAVNTVGLYYAQSQAKSLLIHTINSDTTDIDWLIGYLLAGLILGEREYVRWQTEIERERERDREREREFDIDR